MRVRLQAVEKAGIGIGVGILISIGWHWQAGFGKQALACRQARQPATHPASQQTKNATGAQRAGAHPGKALLPAGYAPPSPRPSAPPAPAARAPRGAGPPALLPGRGRIQSCHRAGWATSPGNPEAPPLHGGGWVEKSWSARPRVAQQPFECRARGRRHAAGERGHPAAVAPRSCGSERACRVAPSAKALSEGQVGLLAAEEAGENDNRAAGLSCRRGRAGLGPKRAPELQASQASRSRCGMSTYNKVAQVACRGTGRVEVQGYSHTVSPMPMPEGAVPGA